MKNKDYFFYGETAFHHEGDFEYLRGMIDLAARTGMDGIKFQVLIEPSAFLSTRSSNFETLKSFCLSRDEWEKAFEYARGKNLKIVHMPLDEAALGFIEKYDCDYVEIHPVLAHKFDFLKSLNHHECPVSLGVGGMKKNEIDEILELFGDKMKSLMFGFQSFPSEIEKLGLGRIVHLMETYPNLEIGYADHSSYASPWAVKSLEYAYLLGVRIFEKHITSGMGEKRVDYESAVGEPIILETIHSLNFIKDNVVRSFESLFEMNEEETRYRARRLKWVASEVLTAGNRLSQSNMVLKMTSEPGGFSDLRALEGGTVKRNIQPDELIKEEDIDHRETY